MSWRLHLKALSSLLGIDQSYDAVIVALADEVIIGRAFIDNFRITLDHGRRVLVEP